MEHEITLMKADGQERRQCCAVPIPLPLICAWHRKAGSESSFRLEEEQEGQSAGEAASEPGHRHDWTLRPEAGPCRFQNQLPSQLGKCKSCTTVLQSKSWRKC